MKKSNIVIPVLIFFGVLSLGSFSSAYALTTQSATNVSFHMSQTPNYFLKGSFNDWDASLSYLFTDNTDSMVEETNKIKELVISKNLSKDDELKVWDTTDTWYTQGISNCTYEDKWNRETANEGNYVVPMTASYEIKVKLFSTGDKKVTVTAPDLDTLYLAPSANWKSDNARFAAYFFNGGGDPIWMNMTDANSDEIYEVSIPNGYSSVIFARMNPDTVENNFNDGVKWNQTGDLNFSITDYKNKFTIPGSGWDSFGNENWGSM